MAKLPETGRKIWENRQDVMVFATVGANMIPEAVYVTWVKLYDDEHFVIADNHFHKTRANVLSGRAGALLLMDKDANTLQVKGELEYVTEGPIFDDMKQWLPTDLPGVAAVVLNIDEVYSGVEKLH